MHAVEVGPFDAWFPEHDVTPFPYNPTFEDAEWDPLLVLHTSGSTGIPKPIVCRHGMLAIGDAYHNVPDWEGRPTFVKGFAVDSEKRGFIPMPLFHAAGMYFFFLIAVYWGTPVAFGLPDRPLSSDLVTECLKFAGVKTALLPPAILEDMSQDDACIAELAKMNSVLFGGGNLAREAGNRLVKRGVRLQNVISATEFIPFPIFQQPNFDLWQWFIVSDDIFGTDWRKVAGEDDVYQLVVVRKDQHPGLQGFFYTFPDAKEYDTKDLYKPHPTLPNHWLYYGRADNIIVFSNGEKLNPVTIEEIVVDHPRLKGALVVGSNRFQPGLIIEPVAPHPKDEREAQELIDSVWPYVVHANEETVAHGQIGRDFIVVSNPEKPFLRAGKGTVQRAGTVKLYKDEIDNLYEKVGRVSSTDAPRVDVSSVETLMKSIGDLFETHLGRPVLAPDADFFSAGVDSMQVINASRLIRAGLEAAGHHVDAAHMATRVIYSNPTPQRLAQYIYSLVRGQSGHSTANGEHHELQSMKALWQKYTRDLPEAKKGRPAPADEGQTILLTGSTGMLGSYLLDLLVRNPHVKRVVCLNRADDGGAKQQARAMHDRGLAPDYATKTTFLHADMSRSDFGLPREDFAQLLETCDRIIHNAWPVNFNIPTESFEPHIRGTRNVANFAAAASKRVAVAFISSIGTVDRWDAKQGLIPERRLEDLELPGGGYGRSKMISSLILEDVAKVAGFPAAIIRVGQIAGPEAEAGFWNKQEWLPSIIASSLYLGALPYELGHMNRVDWTPVERIAQMVLEIDGVSQKLPWDKIEGYYHGVNPSATTWNELAPAVQSFYGETRISELIPFKDWIDRLEESQARDTKSLGKNPGLKLLDAYKGMASPLPPMAFDVTKTLERSPAMRAAKPVTPELMQHWCGQWGF
ncbi:nonribosomal peptide synthetase [Xylariomycetidae sp. FL0641]|nr:nonribosomal peptide synthetase [Xylariomycetidae sp. FL0641]